MVASEYRGFLLQKQSLSSGSKIILSERTIRDFYEGVDGKVHIAFSGGKDSTVLLHLVRAIYPDTPAIFVDTGLEFPEVREFVKTLDNVEWLKPKMPFKQVIEKYGYPVISKQVARTLMFFEQPSEKNRVTRQHFLEDYYKLNKFSGKWQDLFLSGHRDFKDIDDVKYIAPFKVSDKCCDIMKKQPEYDYSKRTGTFSYTGVMAEDSERRAISIMRTGCNSFTGHIQSRPLSYWLQKDIWGYMKKFKLDYSKIYDMGENHTGCAFCMFGVHLDTYPNRFQRMKGTHPKLHSYCIKQLGLSKVLEYIKVPYNPTTRTIIPYSKRCENGRK